MSPRGCVQADAPIRRKDMQRWSLHQRFRFCYEAIEIQQTKFCNANK